MLNAFVYQVHEVTKNAGFARIITEMGTEVRGKFLSKKYGYIHSPTPEKFNR